MVSKRREFLKESGFKEDVFFATVQYSNYSERHLILTDVFIPDENGKATKIVEHVHVYNVNEKILKKLRRHDLIVFKAIMGRYNTEKYDSVITNYAFEYVNSVRKVGGKM